jgi:hypothetical protein
MTRPQLGIEIIELFTLSAFVPTSEHTQNASRRDAAEGKKPPSTFRCKTYRPE